jgi:hypothetical protein
MMPLPDKEAAPAAHREADREQLIAVHAIPALRIR